MAPDMFVFGAAPSLTVMLFPAMFYIAYLIAGRYADPTNLRAMGYLVFMITPWLLLPIDALAVTQGWWSFPTVVAFPNKFAFRNKFAFVFEWDSVLYPVRVGHFRCDIFLMMGRVRKIRFRGNGQFFAMIIAMPLLAGVQPILIALIQVIVRYDCGIRRTVAIGCTAGGFLLLLPLAMIFECAARAAAESGGGNEK